MRIDDLLVADEQQEQQAQMASLQSPFPAPPWGMQVEVGDWRTMGVVDPERAAKVTPEMVIEQVKKKREASRRSRAHLEPTWRYHEDMFARRIRDPDKEEWQADLQVPEVYDAIRSLRSLARSGLFGSAGSSSWMRFTEYDSNRPMPELRPAERMVRYFAERGRMREAVLDGVEQAGLCGSLCVSVGIEDYIRSQPEIQMIPVTNDPRQAFEMAQMGMPTMRPQVKISPRAASQIAFRWENLWYCYPDPYSTHDGDMKFMIVDYEVDEEDIEDRWRAGIYDDISDIGEPMRRRDEYYNPRSRLDLPDQRRGGIRRRHTVTEFVGNIHDEEGKCVAKNWRVTLVNDRAIVRTYPNPLWWGQTGYVWHSLIPCQGRIWGVPPVETTAEVQEYLSTLTNLAITDSMYSVLGVFKVDQFNCDEPPENLYTMEPGRVYHGRGNFLDKIQLASQANSIFPLMNYLTAMGDKSDRVSADAIPNSGSRYRSETEVSTKTAVSTQYLQTMFEEVDEGLIKPLLELTLQLFLQFGDDFTDPSLQEILQEWGGSQYLDTPEKRLWLLSRPFKIRAQGLSMVLDRDRLASRTMQMVQMLGNMGFMQSKPQAVLRGLYNMFEAAGFDPTQWGFADTVDQEHQTMMMMQQQQMQQAGGASQGPAGGGTAAPEPVPGMAAAAPPSPGSELMQNQASGPPAP